MKMIKMRLLTLLGVLVNSVRVKSSDGNYTPDAMADMILELPGLEYEINFNQFSGYLNINGTGKHIFYWYVESQNDPENDPVTYWTNGGPGCSGLLGFGTEMGPYIFQKDGTMLPNEYSWNKVTNMVFFEQPVGVGFSYSENPDVDYETGDEQAAIDQYEAIKAFFRKFPERKSNDFYITSESYGGHYMPQLALTILKEDTHKEINFKGFAVGNPYVDPNPNAIAMWQMYYYRGLVEQPVYEGWVEQGCDKPEIRKEKISACILYEDKMIVRAGYYGINYYALDYPVCLEEDDSHSFLTKDLRKTDHLWSHQGSKLLSGVSPTIKNYIDNYEPCVDDYFTAYLNREDVQDAIHANLTDGQWSVCSDKIYWEFKDRWGTVTDLYYDLVHGGYDIDMLVYSGDDDSVCATSGTQDWIWELDVEPKKRDEWQIWKVDGQIAGYVTQYEIDCGCGSFVFATVHGAGHELPTYKPKEALDLFVRFLKRDWELEVIAPEQPSELTTSEK